MLIAVGCMIIIFYVGGNVYGAILGKDTGISNNFQAMADKINAMAADDPKEVNFYLTKGYSIAGFNNDIYPIKYSCGIFSKNNAVAKPNVAACKDSACICVCSKNGNCERPKECRSIPGIKNIYFNPEPRYSFDAGDAFYNNNQGMHYFYIQTSCVIRESWTASNTFNVEKKIEGADTNLYIKYVKAQ
jgi:hypothetical protein